jgi:hypothetical protein
LVSKLADPQVLLGLGRSGAQLGTPDALFASEGFGRVLGLLAINETCFSGLFYTNVLTVLVSAAKIFSDVLFVLQYRRPNQ